MSTAKELTTCLLDLKPPFNESFLTVLCYGEHKWISISSLSRALGYGRLTHFVKYLKEWKVYDYVHDLKQIRDEKGNAVKFPNKIESGIDLINLPSIVNVCKRYSEAERTKMIDYLKSTTLVTNNVQRERLSRLRKKTDKKKEQEEVDRQEDEEEEEDEDEDVDADLIDKESEESLLTQKKKRSHEDHVCSCAEKLMHRIALMEQNIIANTHLTGQAIYMGSQKWKDDLLRLQNEERAKARERVEREDIPNFLKQRKIEVEPEIRDLVEISVAKRREEKLAELDKEVAILREQKLLEIKNVTTTYEYQEVRKFIFDQPN